MKKTKELSVSYKNIINFKLELKNKVSIGRTLPQQVVCGV